MLYKQPLGRCLETLRSRKSLQDLGKVFTYEGDLLPEEQIGNTNLNDLAEVRKLLRPPVPMNDCVFSMLGNMCTDCSLNLPDGSLRSYLPRRF